MTRVTKPSYMRLANEASLAFQNLPKKKCIKYQLVPPVMHRLNAAENVICTFKEHFIVGL